MLESLKYSCFKPLYFAHWWYKSIETLVYQFHGSITKLCQNNWICTISWGVLISVQDTCTKTHRTFMFVDINCFSLVFLVPHYVKNKKYMCVFNILPKTYLKRLSTVQLEALLSVCDIEEHVLEIIHVAMSSLYYHA